MNALQSLVTRFAWSRPRPHGTFPHRHRVRQRPQNPNSVAGLLLSCETWQAIAASS